MLVLGAVEESSSGLLHEIIPTAHHTHPHNNKKLTGQNLKFPFSSCKRAWFLETLLSVIYKDGIDVNK